jgi:hypothetical protein
MFGLGFILIGIVILLQAAGVFGNLSPALVWGITFILIGIIIASRSSMRRKRRAEWMAKRREKRGNIIEQKQVSDEEKS